MLGGSSLRLVQFPPILLLNVDAEFAGCGFDPLPGLVPFCVRHTFDLIEARNRITNVRGIVYRLLFLFREREFLRRNAIAMFFVEFAHTSNMSNSIAFEELVPSYFAAYVLLNPLRPLVTVNSPVGKALTLIQWPSSDLESGFAIMSGSVLCEPGASAV